MSLPQKALTSSNLDRSKIDFRLHKFQEEAWDALDDQSIREIGLVAGIQGGKTSFGALGMLKKITEWSTRYPDANYLITADSYKTLHQATIPTFLKIMGRKMGRYVNGKEEFVLKTGGKVFARTDTDPNSVEGIPDCAFAWMDEAGKCSKLFQINVLGRVARLQGQVLYTSTPYSLNWLYKDVEKPFREGARKDISFIQFASHENPSFPKEEFERQRQILDPRTFRRKYMGLHERLEGLVYELTSDNFIDPYSLPRGTRYFAGIDFGFAEGHEFAAVIRAFTPEGYHIDIQEFKQAGLDPNAQVMMCKSLASVYPIETWYCDPARPDMISAFNKAGLSSIGFQVGKDGFKPIMAGITKQIELIRSGRYKIFRGKLPLLEDEFETYHWPENKDGRIEKEVPVPINDHILDAVRYVSVGTMHLEKEREAPLMGSRTYPHIDYFDPTKKNRKQSWENM